MHLLLAQKGSLADADEAIDLGQQPADLIFISAADTELACLSAARAQTDDGISLRLANLTALSHPMSIDVYCEKTVTGSRAVIVRCLGGEAYWSYGLETVHATCVANGIPLIVVPGDDKPDASLDRFNTASEVDRLLVWSYLNHGGVTNAASLLEYVGEMLAGADTRAAEPAPLLKAGLWWPGEAAPTLSDVQAGWLADAPATSIIFYRALLQSGNTEPIAQLIEALRKSGVNALPIFISSLKDAVSQETVRGLFSDAQPSVVINMTGFAVSSPDGQRQPTVLEEGSAVVLQAVLAANSEEAWLASDQGLTSRDLAMNVALPEVDGRVLARAIAFKNAETFDDATQANIVRHVAEPGRVSFVAQLAANWCRLRAASVSDRRVALVLANYPNRDGRLGNGVGLDTPAGTVEVLNAMGKQGYEVGDLPADGNALIDELIAGPTNAATDSREIRETLSLNQYKAFFDELPVENQNQVVERWGAPENDPFFL